MNILGISGSLRNGSYNTAILHAMKEVMPDGVGLEVYQCGELPLYNSDLEAEGTPGSVENLNRLVTRADALLFSTPEYNHGIPGLLKNAIDWASRPAFKSPLTGKPAGILSASMSPVGGARAQAALRNVLAGTLSPVFPHIEMVVPVAQEKFDSEGRLTDEKTRERFARYATAFVKWIQSQR